MLPAYAGILPKAATGGTAATSGLGQWRSPAVPRHRRRFRADIWCRRLKGGEVVTVLVVLGLSSQFVTAAAAVAATPRWADAFVRIVAAILLAKSELDNEGARIVIGESPAARRREERRRPNRRSFPAETTVRAQIRSCHDRVVRKPFAES